MSPAAVVTGRWNQILDDLVSSATSRLTLCAPYISEGGAAVVRDARRNCSPAGCRVLVLTDLSPLAICAGATDPRAVSSIERSVPNVRTVHLPRLHAKVYAADGSRAIVTSGNLTDGGLRFNYECGVVIDDAAVACQIENEIVAYAALGAEMDRSTLERVCELTLDARAAYRSQIASASRVATRRLRAALRASSDTLIRARLAEGPVHAVFARTIEYLLRRHGPLTTEQLHPMIKEIHPDLCDDTVDRVIDGKHFGKKWKHAVRTAQQQLKKRATIELREDNWTLIT
jgi:hypothetical protein